MISFRLFFSLCHVKKHVRHLVRSPFSNSGCLPLYTCNHLCYLMMLTSLENFKKNFSSVNIYNFQTFKLLKDDNSINVFLVKRAVSLDDSLSPQFKKKSQGHICKVIDGFFQHKPKLK